MSGPLVSGRSTETALFLGNENAALFGKLMLVGGVVLCLGAILVGGALIMLPPELDPGPTALVWVTTAPILAGLMLCSAGMSQWRAPQQVDIDAEGVTVHSGMGTRRVDWSAVATLQTGERSTVMGHATLKTVRLLGPGQRVLLELNSHVQPFDDLVVKLWEFGAQDRELEVTDVAHRKRRTEAWLLVLLGPAFAALGVWVINESSHELQQREVLKKNAISTEAVIEKHYKFNVTPRLEYVFRDEAGFEHRRDTIVASHTWSRLKAGDKVAVRYLTEDPDYSRLAQGDMDDRQSHDPQLMLLAGPLCAVMGLGFFIAGVLQFCGVDVDRWLGLKKSKMK